MSIQPIIVHAPTRPLDVLPEAMQASRRGVSIVSVYPGNLRHMMRHNGTIIYEIPAPIRGSYSKLVVYDTQQWVRNTNNVDEKGAMPLIPQPIPAMVVANNLVNIWAGDTLGRKSGYRPGVNIISGEDPTPTELSKLRSEQDGLFNWYIISANDLFIKGESKEITDIHRMAAKFMLDKGAERLPWYPKIDFAEVKNCIACGKQIYATALRCEHCTTNLPNWYMDYGIAPVSDPVVSAFIQRIMESRARRPVDMMPAAPPAQEAAPAPDLAEQLAKAKDENERLRQAKDHPVDPKAPRLVQQ